MAATMGGRPPSTDNSKRKAAMDVATSLGAQGPRKRSKPTRKKKGDQMKKASDIFRFVDLPGELRDNVYEKVFEGRPTRLHRNSANKPLAIESGLARSNHPNKCYLIAFFNRLSEAQLAKLQPSKEKTPAKRVVRIELMFAIPAAGIETPAFGFPREVRHLPAFDNCFPLWWPISRDVNPATSTGRRFREARKIFKAILKATSEDCTKVPEWRVGGLKEDVEGEDEECGDS
ncbi:hypothetical protein CLAFUW4_03831 [Fulvia fulva]|uniref:Uncharacterized protein n=1 Tax=Passalora fulva TaxID=5499 RepID=A0A9Q8LBU7_PASFU|nr:uncharacterized protein CLAFUR5_03803 [Fulvia fulva]KAK4630872.1 hypothetical protein CLAFUR4_03819 [Fulvia fulva]KAK4633375.1 hypothetical protein CLAFUR0_03818 [Fulvia fulva]UJO14547.1 hypothetical protein CLAFUR5_03803 [Fulvia fulva]WPV11078.1 hypothetical protein CLAFUW4_03831 [Fulvia fulva]WPV26045.1 hypothetical protein CLAFUW7_03823 [Fulvia fulva]